MPTVAAPIIVTVIRNAPLRPTLSPTRPKISAPIGRKKNPAPNRPSAARSPAVGSRAVKKFLAITGARVPKTKKSYHSKVVPITEAATTVGIGVTASWRFAATAGVTASPATILEGVLAGDGAAEDQGVDVMGPLVGVDRFQVRGVAHHVVLAADPVAAMHVPRHPGDLQGLAAIVALHQTDRLGNPGPLVDQPAEGQRALEAESDLREHVGQLLLHQLTRGQGLAEHLTRGDVVPRRVQAELRRPHRPP